METEKIKIYKEHEAILQTTAELGLVTVNILKTLFPESEFAGWSDGMVRYAIRKLCEMSLLSEYQVSLAGKRGQPENAYLLTEAGARACEQLEIKASPLNITSEIALAHRLCQVWIAVKARTVNLEAGIEQVLVYNHESENLRADVLVQGAGQGSRVIEVEQAITRSHLPRAVQKFTSLGEIYTRRKDLHLSSQALIVFNLRNKEFSEALGIWSDALGAAYPNLIIPFDVHYCTVLEFLDNPSFEDVTVFPKLEGRVKPAGKKAKAHTDLLEPPPLPLNATPLELYGRGMAIRPEMVLVTDPDAPRYLNLLGQMAWSFYEPDFNEYNGQTALYSADPVNSLGCLREFLYDPRHKLLFELMKREVARFRKQATVTVQMTAALEMAWSFLGAFKLAMGGPLKVYATAPLVGDNAEQLQYKLSLDTAKLELLGEGHSEQYLRAIAWLLNAFLFYPRELGLVDEPLWSRKPKAR